MAVPSQRTELLELALRLHELLQQFKYDFEGDRHGKENESDPGQEARFDENRAKETSNSTSGQLKFIEHRAAQRSGFLRGINVFPRPLLSHFRLAGVFVAPTSTPET
jgi:hypothetical protein